MTKAARACALLVLVYVVVVGSAMLRTSATFDEIVFGSVGARGFATGDFSMVDDHPRLPQYVYGIPTRMAADRLPPENGAWGSATRYNYARTLVWGSGNVSERILMANRLVGLAFGAMLVLATFLIARRWIGDGAALAAAALVALTPDVLAHGGVAYTDIPVTLGVLVGVFALDAAIRDPRPGRVALAALATALAVAIKYSAVILGPIAFALVVAEALSGRARDASWRRAILVAIPVFAVVAYAVVVAIYLGDWRLREFTAGLSKLFGASLNGRVAFLWGESNVGGWWYFFPVAFALKTPIAMQALAALALVAAVRALPSRAGTALLVHPLRAPAIAAVLFAASVLTAKVNIGSRHALPLVPLLAILVAGGIAWWWPRLARTGRYAVGVFFAATAISSLAQYPFFISYVSGWANDRPLHATLVDSSTDWGQGLIALREHMAANGIDRILLGYFGSAIPEGYGIRYVPMPSFFPLPEQPIGGDLPRYMAVSATLLTPTYLRDDPFAPLRRAPAVTVVGGSIVIFDRAVVEGR